MENASLEVEEPMDPLEEKIDSLSPDDKQEDVSSDTETNPEENEDQEGRDVELGIEDPMEESAPPPEEGEETIAEPKDETEDFVEAPDGESTEDMGEAPDEEPIEGMEEEQEDLSEEMDESQEESPDEEVVYEVNTAVDFIKAGPLLPPVLGVVSALEGSMRRTMGTRDLLVENDLRTIPTETSGDSSVMLKKNAAYDEASHTVEITLEAFATGEFTTIIEHIPADIVLVLDQSGSMGDDMNGTEVTNAYLYNISSTLFALSLIHI